MPNLYIIAGGNGAGKTTGSYTILPEILHCKEYVNADLIAHGISPFNQEAVALQAGRIMLQRIRELLRKGIDFVFEKTLSTRSYYIPLIKEAKQRSYTITLVDASTLIASYHDGLEEQKNIMKEPEVAYGIRDDDDIVEKVRKGLLRAYRKLVLESAARDEKLVVWLDGRVQHVPAKDLIHTIVEEE